MTPVAFARKPFGQDVYRGQAPEGASLAEIVAGVPDLPPAFFERGVVCINGEPVPPPLWQFVRPRPAPRVPVAVTLHLPLRGSGQNGQKNPLALVASVAVLALAAWAGPAGATAIGLTGGTLLHGLTAAAITATISVGGALAIAALSPPPKINQQLQEPTAGSAAAGGNVLEPGGPVPRVIGSHRVFPVLLAYPLVEVVNDDEYVEAVFGLAGPHALSDIRVGDVPLTALSDVTVQTREGWPTDTALTLITRTSRTEGTRLTLAGHKVKTIVNTDGQPQTGDGQYLTDQATPANSLPQWAGVPVRDAPNQIWITLAWPSGLSSTANQDRQIAVPIRLRMRLVGSGTWINLPEIHFRGRGTPFSRIIALIFQNNILGMPTAPTGRGPFAAYKFTPAQSQPPAGGGSWTAHSSFSTAGGGDAYPGNMRNIRLVQDRAELYLDASIFPPGQYELQIQRGMAYESTGGVDIYNQAAGIFDLFGYVTDVQHKTTWSQTTLRSETVVARVSSIWNGQPVTPGSGFAIIALKAKNRQVDQLSVLAEGYVRDWNGSSWSTWTTTQNAGVHLYDVLAGDLSDDPIPAALLDNADLVAFRNHCTVNQLKCNAVVAGRSGLDVATMIASCGYGRPRQSEKWGVFIDKSRVGEAPVQVFSPRNLQNFRWEKAFARMPDGFRVRFTNKDEDYKEDELIVLDPEQGTGGIRLEEIRYDGLVTTAEVQTRALFDLKQMTRRTTFYSGIADIENLVCRRGDLVAIQHDILTHQAGFARILQKNVLGGGITSLVLDGTVYYDGAGSAAIRTTTGAIITAAFAASGDHSNVISFSGLADSATIVEGCLVVTGPSGSAYKRFLVFDVVPQTELQARLTFVDEAPDLFT